MKKLCAFVLALVAAVSCVYDGDIVLNNGMVRLSFDRADGSIQSFVDIERGEEQQKSRLKEFSRL